jgi:hypothetical protein
VCADEELRQQSTSRLDGILAKEAAASDKPCDAENPRISPPFRGPTDGYIRFCGHALHLECYDSYVAAKEEAVRHGGVSFARKLRLAPALALFLLLVVGRSTLTVSPTTRSCVRCAKRCATRSSRASMPRQVAHQVFTRH